MAYDYKGRPRMVSSQQGMIAADQGDCSALGETAAAEEVWSQTCLIIQWFTQHSVRGMPRKGPFCLGYAVTIEGLSESGI